MVTVDYYCMRRDVVAREGYRVAVFSGARRACWGASVTVTHV